MNSHGTNETFLYFAYGSNLLKKRIHINNPTAVYTGIGRLEDHRLDFIKYSDCWGGSSATIVPTKNSHIWGAVWRVNYENLPALDIQEGVDTNWYFPKHVKVIMPGDFEVECRTYQQTINPTDNSLEIPPERRPSITYLDVIIEGAIQCQLPEYYIQQLKKIPHNGKEASSEMLEKLKK